MTLWLAYAKAGKELEVQQALADIGITAHCAKVIEARRVGKRHRPDIFIDPLLPNYLFIECDAAQYLEVIGTKHIAPMMAMVPAGDLCSVMTFLDAAKNEFENRMSRIAAGERLEQFAVGDLLNVIDGPLAGLSATFMAISEGDRGVFPSVVADVEMMDRVVTAKLDVLHVKKAV